MKANRLFITLLLILTLPGLAANTFTPEDKPRIIVLTDIENEPDDAESLVRFLTYSNQFDVEGIIAHAQLLEMHFILAVTDNGLPALTRYRRVIVKVKSKKSR